MAGVDVLCSDKTGTITKNELTVVTAQTFGKFTLDDILLFGALASREENHDPLMTQLSPRLKKTKTLPLHSATIRFLTSSRLTQFRKEP